MNRIVHAGLLAATLHMGAPAADLARYRLVLPGGAAVPERGASLSFPGAAMAQLRVGGLVMAIDPAAPVPAGTDLVLLTRPGGGVAMPAVPVVLAAGSTHVQAGRPYALATWQAMTVRKGDVRLRITAMPAPGAPGQAGAGLTALLDFGPGCRILVHGQALAAAQVDGIARHYPGARLAVWQEDGAPVLLTIGTAGQSIERGPRRRTYRFGMPSCRAS